MLPVASGGRENTVGVNTTRPDPEGWVETQIARIIEQAQEQGLRLTGVGGLHARRDQASR